MTVGFENVAANIAALPLRKKAAALALSKAYGAKSGTYAQQNRRWTDRTSHARGGLKGDAKEVGPGIRVYACHTMDYGLYLELCNSGKYAILEESLEHDPQSLSHELEIMMSMP